MQGNCFSFNPAVIRPIRILQVIQLLYGQIRILQVKQQRPDERSLINELPESMVEYCYFSVSLYKAKTSPM